MSDVIVIGGGIAGVATAARLAPHAHVTLLESEAHLGYHASGRSAAMFEENYGAPAVCALSRASRVHFETGDYLSPRGIMILSRAHETEAFEADMQALHCAEIDMDTARQMVPILADTVTRAAYHAEAEDIDTDRLIQDFARIIRANGGVIQTGSTVSKITRRDGKWQVMADGTFSAPILINAAGAWADHIAKLAGVAPIGLTPCRRSMARMPAPGGHDVQRWPMFFGPGETWYAKPDAGKLIVSPAEEDATAPQDAWADDMIIAEGIARYQGFVSEPVNRVETTWAGLRTFAPDRQLVLGPDPDQPSFIWCAGQGGYGFQTAPAASQLVADLTLGHVPAIDAEVAAALHPKRFR